MEQALQAGSKAEQDLRRAKGLADYRQATEQLERELLKLSGLSLTSAQHKQREQLQITARQAREILAEEVADLIQLQRASEALDAAQTVGRDARHSELETARQALNQIPPRSFSANQAKRLRRQLNALDQ
ncbi:hypothetical protein [Cyanobium gracile]|uniref:hypothetical protein n=1 Tax=Cyanobium gracile TaxID=59930 RepID=UPI0012EA5255|nr:hypothetical protein [Cyanobium gracile]